MYSKSSAICASECNNEPEYGGEDAVTTDPLDCIKTKVVQLWSRHNGSGVCFLGTLL
jgi:hypothetical protein